MGGGRETGRDRRIFGSGKLIFILDTRSFFKWCTALITVSGNKLSKFELKNVYNKSRRNSS